jgi:hypothetical protein
MLYLGGRTTTKRPSRLESNQEKLNIFSQLIKLELKYFLIKQKLISLSKNLLEELNHVRDVSNNECLLINKKESIAKIEDVLTLISSYLTRLPVNITSFEWLFTLKYYSNQQTKQISVQVFYFFILQAKNLFFYFYSSV